MHPHELLHPCRSIRDARARQTEFLFEQLAIERRLDDVERRSLADLSPPGEELADLFVHIEQPRCRRLSPARRPQREPCPIDLEGELALADAVFDFCQFDIALLHLLLIAQPGRHGKPLAERQLELALVIV